MGIKRSRKDKRPKNNGEKVAWNRPGLMTLIFQKTCF